MSFFDIFKIRQYKDAIAQLERQLKQSEATLSQIKLENSKLKQTSIELKCEINNLKNFIQVRLPLFDSDALSAHYDSEYFPRVWEKYWDCIDHNEYYQKLRLHRATSATMTPLSIDKRNGWAFFLGEETVYKTSLTSCQCRDFQRHFKPCKHMYRLAHELEVYTLPLPIRAVSEPKKLMSKTAIARKLNQLSSDSLELIQALVSAKELIIPYKEAEQLLRLDLAVINPNKYNLLNSFRKDELVSMLSGRSSGVKSLKKSLLIEKIISDYPDIILEIERNTVGIKISPYASRISTSYFYWK